jgi:hypothetical protein
MDEQSSLVNSQSKRHTESNEQIAAMDWLRAQHPKISLHTLHIGNERKASYYAGYIMKRMGVLKGASDLLVAWPSGGFHGLFIEVKAKKGKPTPDQLAFIERMNSVGYYATVCYGADEVIRCMKWYIGLGHQGTSSSSTPAS